MAVGRVLTALPNWSQTADERPYLWEVQLSQGHWANLPADLARWYRYNHERESRAARQRAADQITS